MAEPAAFLDQPEPDISYPGGHPRITVRPAKTRAPISPRSGVGTAPMGGSMDDLPAYVDPAEQRPANAPPSQSMDELPAYVDTSVPMQPEREVSTGQALAQGVGAGVGLGFSPAIQGLQAAAQAPGGENTKQAVEAVQSGIETVNPFSRLAKMIGLPQDHETLQGLARLFQRGGDQPAQQAYVQGRDVAQETQDLAAKQHPGAFYPGMIAGTVALPVPGGPVAGAGRLANVGRGVATGAILGGTQGVGEGVSRGESAADVAARGASGAIVGGAIGGPLGAVLPRGAPAIQSAGQRAAQTAGELGAPLPRGVVSDRPFIQSTTSRLRQMPFAGERIGSAVHRTEQAAGTRVEDIAGQMTGGTSDRAAANALVRPGLEQAIEANRAHADALYNGVRGAIDQTAEFTMPRTAATLDAIVAARQAAHHVDPEAGLEQFRSLATGATFNGAHRARTDARDLGNALVPHPGYNAADYNRLTRAMTADLRSMVAAAATDQSAAGQRTAVDTFNRAEAEFGPIAEANKRLNTLVRGQGEGAIAKLIGAAKEKGGDVQLLAQLQRTMPPAEFQHIGGQLLFELGHSPRTGEFSLAKFVTEWDKLSDRGRDILFTPQHRADLENIFQMGQHVKGALKESSTSHSANMLVAWEVLSHVAGLIHDIATGSPGTGTAITGAGGTAAAYTLTHWLANPVQARAISNWTSAYRAATLGQPTPARIAAFKIATRNLASNINLPVEDVMRIIQQRLPTAAEPSADNQRPKVPGPSR